MLQKTTGKLWKRPKENIGEGWKSRLIQWRKEKVVTKAERPTRSDRAHSLGYKAKQGYVIARVRVQKGKRKRPKFKGGRVPKKMGRFFPAGKSNQLLCEERAARKFPNMEVLGSYYVAEDGKHDWYECVLADPNNANISRDRERKWIADKQHKKRVFRTLTSSGRKIRGLRKK
jgi:large subunit ribosomal protein L15e